MILKIIRRMRKKQKGFTIIELIVAVAILSIIGTGVGVTLTQTIKGNNDVKYNMTAVNNVRSAGYWMTRDIQMSQYMSNYPSSLTLTNGIGQLDLERSDFVYSASVSKLFKTTYKILGTDLQRTDYIDPTGTGNSYEQQSQITVASNIYSISSNYANNMFSITITPALGTGPNSKLAETFQIQPRT